MDCYGFNNVISDYIDNNLSATERRQADLHLQECDECRDKLECMISMLDDLHHLPKICCCERFEDELMKKIHDYKTKKQRPVVAAMQQYSRYISLAAAMVLLVAASLFVYSSLNVESGGSS